MDRYGGRTELEGPARRRPFQQDQAVFALRQGQRATVLAQLQQRTGCRRLARLALCGDPRAPG